MRIEEREGRREVELTPSGRGLHDRISKVALEREDLMLKGFSAKEREAWIYGAAADASCLTPMPRAAARPAPASGACRTG